MSESVVTASRQCVIELEGTAFKYEPIFGNLFRQTVSDILCLAARALAVADDTIADSTRVRFMLLFAIQMTTNKTSNFFEE